MIAIAGVAGFVGHKFSAKSGPGEAGGFMAMRNRMMKRMMASMPEDSPPKLIMSILPRLQAQNAQILALLEEQNDLLRQLSAGEEHK